MLKTMFEVAGSGLLLTATRGQTGRIEGGHKGAVAVMELEGILPPSQCIFWKHTVICALAEWNPMLSTVRLHPLLVRTHAPPCDVKERG